MSYRDMKSSIEIINEEGQRVLPTIIDMLDKHTLEKSDQTALVFLSDGDEEVAPITFGEFQERALRFASGIRKHTSKGDRVILLFQSSYEFAISFIGCMYASLISIPLPMPSRRVSEWIRFENILDNSGAKVVVSYEKVRARLISNAEKNMDFTKINLYVYEDLVSNTGAVRENISGLDKAFLQYTSGSTGAPKGVVLEHNNLIENQILLQKGYGTHGDSRVCSWLPMFHDMGLIGKFLHAIFIGQTFIFMAPNTFLQKPIRWLRAISDYKVFLSGAPNFAYDLCVEKIKEEDKIGLDLSSWKSALNGAEPVRAETLKRFSQTFKSVGFDEKTFYPCYGSAEATLIISGAEDDHTMPKYLNIDRDLYEKNIIKIIGDLSSANTVTLVSSGNELIKNSIAIVDSKTKSMLPERVVGEIWVSSPANAVGYWDNPEASKETFCNRINDDEINKDYLNTGDLGFFDGEDIYITGRSKDLLIFNGRNIYPQDIEQCSAASHFSLKTGRCAAVSLYIDGRERLILVHELERFHAKKAPIDEVIENIRIAVYKEFLIPVYAVALVSPSSIPMTSSGKIRRQSCREQFQNSTLSLIACWSEDMGDSASIQSEVGAI